MENASRALLMAGGVLIAIIIISLLVRTYGNIGIFQRQQLSAEEAEKLEAYNKEYTKYLNQYVYGTEVITVINKVRNSDYDIEVNIEFKDKYEYTQVAYKNGKKQTRKIIVSAGSEMTLTNDGGVYDYIDSESAFFGSSTENAEGDITVSGLKSRAFKCTSIGYDSNGRVNNIKFEEKMYNGGSILE